MIKLIYLNFSVCIIVFWSMWNKESPSYLQKTADTFEELSTNKQSFSESDEFSEKGDFQIASRRKDDFRCDLAHKDGGFICKDDKQIDKLRSVGKEMIKIIGRRILSGELNLTKISFPIKACSPRTALQNSIESCVIFPHFINRAAATKDPLQRFKLTCVAILSSSSYVDMFLKPLNPIIGQTLQATLKDGTKLYCEQISHHPPISYFLVYGPNKCYQFSGFYNFDVSPGLNSLSLKNKGQRKFSFRDGTEIVASYASGIFNNTFLGTSRVEEAGECQITDTKNGYSIKVQFGKLKKKSSDYFQSFIKRGGKDLQEIFGTYCGFIEISKKRYWDIRDFEPLQLDYDNLGEPKLKSDFSYRKDLQLLVKNKMEEAQEAKEVLEQIQRTDEKLRKKYRAGLKQGHHEQHG